MKSTQGCVMCMWEFSMLEPMERDSTLGKSPFSTPFIALPVLWVMGNEELFSPLASFTSFYLSSQGKQQLHWWNSGACRHREIVLAVHFCNPLRLSMHDAPGLIPLSLIMLQNQKARFSTGLHWFSSNNINFTLNEISWWFFTQKFFLKFSCWSSYLYHFSVTYR